MQDQPLPTFPAQPWSRHLSWRQSWWCDSHQPQLHHLRGCQASALLTVPVPSLSQALSFLLRLVEVSPCPSQYQALWRGGAGAAESSVDGEPFLQKARGAICLGLSGHLEQSARAWPTHPCGLLTRGKVSHVVACVAVARWSGTIDHVTRTGKQMALMQPPPVCRDKCIAGTGSRAPSLP